MLLAEGDGKGAKAKKVSVVVRWCEGGCVVVLVCGAIIVLLPYAIFHMYIPTAILLCTRISHWCCEACCALIALPTALPVFCLLLFWFSFYSSNPYQQAFFCVIGLLCCCVVCIVVGWCEGNVRVVVLLCCCYCCSSTFLTLTTTQPLLNPFSTPSRPLPQPLTITTNYHQQPSRRRPASWTRPRSL